MDRGDFMINYILFTIVKYLSTALLFAAAAAAQESEIRALIQRQQDDWNRGDVRSFMAGYDEATAFVAAEITRGSAGVLANYKKRYPTRDRMGNLTFTLHEVRLLGASHAYVIGQFHLKRTTEAGGDKTGLFTLVLAKTAAGWRILLDHTNP